MSRVFAGLGPEWTVLHAVSIGRGVSDIDRGHRTGRAIEIKQTDARRAELAISFLAEEELVDQDNKSHIR